MLRGGRLLDPFSHERRRKALTCLALAALLPPLLSSWFWFNPLLFFCVLKTLA